jgi:hypothetical protein
MTPEQVQAAVPQGARTDVTISELGNVGSLLPGLFPEGHLIIDPVLTHDATADGVKVRGTGASGAFAGMTVDIEFRALPDGTLVTAQATGDRRWTFTQAFPPLAHTIFDTLTFDTPVLKLDSTATAMTFTGTLIIDTRTALLDVLMPGVTQAISGQVTTVSGPPGLGFPTSTVPSIMLDGPEGQRIGLGLVELQELRYEIEASPVFDYDVVDWSVQGAITVTGAIPVNIGTERRDVYINTRILGWGEPLLFWGDFSELGDITLPDVARLFKQDDLPVPFDLSSFPGESPVQLTTVSMLVTTSPLSVGYVAFRLQTKKQWNIVDGQFTLDAIDLNFRIDSPARGPQVSGSLAGLIGIGENGTLEVTTGFDEQSAGDQKSREVTFGGSLRGDDGPLSMREVYTQFTGDHNPPVPDLSVLKFYFGLKVPSGDRPTTYQAFLELVGDWKITDGVELTEVMFSVQHDGATTAFTALAIFLIEGVGAKITADYDSAPDKQWQFSGETGPGQQIAIGGLFQTLASRFKSRVTLPAPIAKLIIENIGVRIATGNRTLFLTCEAEFPLDDTAKADITLAIDTGTRTLTAVMKVAVQLEGGGTFTPTFGLFFVGAQKSPQPDPGMFVAIYTHPAGEPVPPLKALVQALSPTAAQYVPDGLSVDLKDAFLAKAGPAYLFGADLKVTIDFTKLPLIGSRLNLGVMGFDPLRLVAASAGLTPSQVTELTGLLATESVGALPDGALAAGFLFDGRLKLGTLEKPLVMPVAGQGAQKAPAPPAQPPAKDTTTADNALWYKVQRSFGPIYIDRVGVAYLHPPNQAAHLAVLLDASLTVAGLTLSLTGLQAGLDLSPGALPSFDLAGAGLSYTQGPLQITGAFLKGTVVYNKQSYPAYGGEVVIKTASLTLGAIGSYMELPEPAGPSLFVYAFLNYAIGGPAFFFVTGLAAGFGYNRRFIPPALDKLADFPLVAEATGTRKPEASLSGELAALNDALPPSPGDYFLTVGIHFTSFKMVDSFLLLVAAFGHRFELDLLGLATLVLPAADAQEGQGPVTPIAEVQLALRATLVPEDGTFSLAAQLTPSSFLLSRDCHLFGGLAFSAWFAKEHTGDFVLSVGGYHPHYTVPSHYPAVPRLGFSWKVSDQLQVSGGAYFALTPAALMAGGTLSATYTDDSLQAWFDASMDFLIGWQPFHYTADVHVAIGASYTFSFFGTHTISAHVDANVHLEGPEFSGTAHIDLTVISFDITFGPGANPPRAMDWGRFRAALLPPAAQVTTITLAGGALVPGKDSGKNDNKDLGVIDPHALELRTESVIPSTAGRRGHEGADAALPTGDAPRAFGVSPLGRRDVTATHRIEITGAHGHVEDRFSFTPATKSLPYALWGGVLEPALTDPALTGPLLTGYVVRPLPPQEPPASPSLPAAVLQAAIPRYARHVIAWAPAARDQLSGDGDPARAAAITRGLTAPGAAAIRAGIAGAVLKGTEISLDGLTAADFLQVPQVTVPQVATP